MSPNVVHQLWQDSWAGDIWITPWSQALDGLTPEQAAWSPAPGRHSIWQLVGHILFWRQTTFDRIAGRPARTGDTPHDEQFPQPQRVDAASWDALRDRLHASHERMQAYLADPSHGNERPRYHLAHDAYHLGQIMYLRALQGLSPLM